MSDKVPWELLEDSVARARDLPPTPGQPHASIVLGWICFGFGLFLVWFVPIAAFLLLSIAVAFGIFSVLFGRSGAVVLFVVSTFLTVAIVALMETAIYREHEKAVRAIEKIFR